MNYPDHWEIAKFGSINSEIDKSGPDPGEEFEYIEISSINRDAKKIEEVDRITAEEASSRAKQHLKSGDLLISKVRPKLNGVSVVPQKYDGAIGTTGFYVVRSDIANSKFLYYFTQTQEFVESMDRKATGSSYPAVKISDIEEYQVPLPPIEEQERIVRKIEEIFSKLNAGVNDLKETTGTIEFYRRSILNNYIFENQSGANINNNNNNNNLSASTYPTLEANGNDAVYPNFNDRPDIPDWWQWVSLAEIFSFKNGDELPKKNRNQGANPVYGGNGKTDVHDDWNIKSRALVIGRVGANCGNVHIAPSNSWVTDNAIYTKEIKEDISLRFMEQLITLYPLNSLSSGTGQAYISQNTLRGIDIPLPPLSTQRKIADRLDSHLSLIENVRDVLSTELQRSDRLRQSVLQSAFRGELMGQKPDFKRSETRVEGIKTKNENEDSMDQATLSEVTQNAQ